MTYQHQVIGYESQAQAATTVIVRLRKEKQEAEERATLGVDRIRHIMSAWRDRTRTSIVKNCGGDSVQQIRYGMTVRVCMYVCERERGKKYIDTENRIRKLMY